MLRRFPLSAGMSDTAVGCTVCGMTYPPQYQQPQYVQIIKQATNGPAVTGMILGIVAVAIGVWSVVPVLGLVAAFFAFVPAILAVVFGHIGQGRSRLLGGVGHGKAIAALVTGYVTLGIIALVTTLWIAALTSSTGPSAGSFS